MERLKNERRNEEKIKKCLRAGSNHGPYDLQSYALPAELQRQSIFHDRNSFHCVLLLKYYKRKSKLFSLIKKHNILILSIYVNTFILAYSNIRIGVQYFIWKRLLYWIESKIMIVEILIFGVKEKIIFDKKNNWRNFKKKDVHFVIIYRSKFIKWKLFSNFCFGLTGKYFYLFITIFLSYCSK